MSSKQIWVNKVNILGTTGFVGAQNGQLYISGYSGVTGPNGVTGPQGANGISGS